MALSSFMLPERFFNALIKDYPELKILNYSYIPEDQQCVRCKHIFFFNGCPHCGNTFLTRDILRQTS